MRPNLLSLVVLLVALLGAPKFSSAAAPSALDVDQIEALSKAELWDELYLSVSAADPASQEASARARIAAALWRGVDASDGEVVLAFSLSEKAAAFQPTAQGWDRVTALALRLRDFSAATAASDRARALAPDDASLKLRRAEIALAQSDFATARALCASIPASDAAHPAAQARLKEIEAREASEAQRLQESAQRDLVKRLRVAEDELAALPVSEFELCRAHTVAACEAVSKCRGDQANCSLLVGLCPDSRKASGLERKALALCGEMLSRVSCSQIEPVIAELSENVCRGLNLRSEFVLVPAEDQPKKKPDSREGDAKGATQAGSLDELLERLQ